MKKKLTLNSREEALLYKLAEEKLAELNSEDRTARYQTFMDKKINKSSFFIKKLDTENMWELMSIADISFYDFAVQIGITPEWGSEESGKLAEKLRSMDDAQQRTVLSIIKNIVPDEWEDTIERKFAYETASAKGYYVFDRLPISPKGKSKVCREMDKTPNVNIKRLFEDKHRNAVFSFCELLTLAKFADCSPHWICDMPKDKTLLCGSCTEEEIMTYFCHSQNGMIRGIISNAVECVARKGGNSNV